jgi:hypothetical protein
VQSFDLHRSHQQEVAMNATAKKALCILISGATLGVAAPAFADRGHDGWDRGHHYGQRYYGGYGPRYYAPRVVVAPAPVYYGAPAYAPAYGAYGSYYPQPYYNPAAGAVVGAGVGAMIGSQLGGYHNRGAATAAGAIIGGILGAEATARY